MEWYEGEVRALQETLRRHSGLETVAFYGSSSIRMWTDLAADLNDPRAVNAGFGGSTLAACAHFFERLIPPLDPISLVVYAGDNDLADGRGPEEVLNSFCTLAGKVERLLPLIPLAFVSIKISPARAGLRDRIVRTNALIRTAIKLQPRFLYIDMAAAMLDSQGQPRPELFLEDGLHLSRAGYRLWAQLLEPYRNQIFMPHLPEIRTAKLFLARDEA